MQKLSITGADDLTSIHSLSQLVSQFPFLEVAILYYPEKENHNRNPGKGWRNELIRTIDKNNLAVHLCGEKVFRAILEPNFAQSKVFDELSKYNRIQININARKNIFSVNEIHKIYTTLLDLNLSLILQYHERSKEWVLPFIQNHRNNPNINILLDSSLGKGVSPDVFNIPEELKDYNYTIGFAGGVSPENIGRIHNQIKSLNFNNYYIDLESGVRTDNYFDLTKAKQLCEIYSM